MSIADTFKLVHYITCTVGKRTRVVYLLQLEVEFLSGVYVKGHSRLTCLHTCQSFAATADI